MCQLAKLAGVNLYGNIDFCEACARGKVRRAPFRNDAHFRRFGLGECWHADLVGPFRTLLRGKYKYVLFFTEDHSGFVTCRLLSRKSEQLSKLLEIVAWSKVQTGNSMRVFRSDGEWNSNEFKEFKSSSGFEHKMTLTNTPQMVLLRELGESWWRRHELHFCGQVCLLRSLGWP